jgi:hypothetical protein
MLTNFLRRPLLVLAVLACAGAAGAGEMPKRFIRLDLADAGPLAKSNGNGRLSLRLVSLGCELTRVRFGVAFADGWGQNLYDDEGQYGMMLPVHIGYGIWSQAKKTAFCYGMVPDVYAQVDFSAIYTPVFKGALCCDLDYYGVGARAMVGGCVFLGSDNFPMSFLFAGIQVRLLTASIGF